MKAIESPTTIAPSASRRRALLSTAAAAMAAGLGTVLPATAEAAPSAEEAELIRLCNRLVAIGANEQKLYRTVPHATLEGEAQLQERLKPGDEEWRRIEERLYELDITPKTPAGISAMARAALAEAERTWDGEIVTLDLCGYLAWGVVESISPEANAAIEADVKTTGAATKRMLAASRLAQTEAQP